MFVRVSSLEVDCGCATWTYSYVYLHTSHRGSRSEGGWNESQTNTQRCVQVTRVDLVSPPSSNVRASKQTLCRFRRNCACDPTTNANRHAATFRFYQARRKPDRLGKGNAKGRPSSRNSYGHAAYPRQRASGTCMKQPSRLDIGSCTAVVRVLSLPTLELVRRSPLKHLPPALRSVRTTLSVRSIAVAHMQTFCPGTAAL